MHRTRTAERPLLIGITVVLRKAASAEPSRRIPAIRGAVLSIGPHLSLCMSPEAMQYARIRAALNGVKGRRITTYKIKKKEC